jgi:hypothetical protein
MQVEEVSDAAATYREDILNYIEQADATETWKTTASDYFQVCFH